MSSRIDLPAVNQAGAATSASSPLPGTFLGLALDLRSDRLYDLVHDIQDVMGLRAIQPSTAIVKVMSVPDSRCVRVVTPDDHVNIGFHETGVLTRVVHNSSAGSGLVPHSLELVQPVVNCVLSPPHYCES